MVPARQQRTKLASIVNLDRGIAESESHHRVHSKKRITSFDIAEKAGVSQATVSRALRGDPSVSEETRRRVEAAATVLNYTVDKNASNLRGRLTGTLALLFFEDPTPHDALQVDAESSQQSGHRASETLLASGATFDAIFRRQQPDRERRQRRPVGAGYRRTVRSGHGRIQRHPMASFVNPSITTVQPGTRRAGEMLVDSLIRLIHNEPAASKMLPTQLIARRSSLRQDVIRSEQHHLED